MIGYFKQHLLIGLFLSIIYFKNKMKEVNSREAGGPVSMSKFVMEI